MRKSYEEPTLQVIKFEMNETITSEDMWTPTLSPGIENWD